MLFFSSIKPAIPHLYKESTVLLIFYKAYLISIFKSLPSRLFFIFFMFQLETIFDSSQRQKGIGAIPGLIFERGLHKLQVVMKSCLVHSINFNHHTSLINFMLTELLGSFLNFD